MKTIVYLFISTLLITSCNQKPQQEIVDNHEMQIQKSSSCDSTRDGLFVHITECYDDPHRVLMPMKMANMMAMDKDVIVYFDIHSVELLVKGAKDLTYADFEPFQTYVKQLLDKNVGIYVCPTCLKIAGYKPEDLMEGIQIAQKDKFFNFTKGRIITLDY